MNISFLSLPTWQKSEKNLFNMKKCYSSPAVEGKFLRLWTVINASTFLFLLLVLPLSLLLMDLKHDVVYYEAESRRLRVEAEMLLQRRKNDLFNFNVEFSQLRCFNVVKWTRKMWEQIRNAPRLFSLFAALFLFKYKFPHTFPVPVRFSLLSLHLFSSEKSRSKVCIVCAIHENWKKSFSVEFCSKKKGRKGKSAKIFLFEAGKVSKAKASRRKKCKPDPCLVEKVY